MSAWVNEGLCEQGFVKVCGWESEALCVAGFVRGFGRVRVCVYEGL